MAIGEWLGRNGGRGGRTSGNWADADNWFGGSVPTADDAVVFAPGRYTVSLTTAAQARGLFIAPDVTFRIASLDDFEDSGGFVRISGALQNHGVIDIANFDKNEAAISFETQGAADIHDNYGTIRETG